MLEKKYQYGFAHHFYYATFAFLLLALVLLIIYGMFQTFFSTPLLFVGEIPFISLIETVLFCLLGIAILLPLSIMAANFLMAYPAISVSETGFKVHFLMAESRWLKWETINHVSSFYPSRDFLASIRGLLGVDEKHLYWLIDVQGLNKPFSLNRFFRWSSHSSFYISPFIQEYGELIRTLRQKRPDLFYK